MKFYFAVIIYLTCSSVLRAVEVAADRSVPLPTVSLHVDTFKVHATKTTTLGDFLSCQGEDVFCTSILMHPVSPMLTDGVLQQAVTQSGLQESLSNIFPHIQINLDPFVQVTFSFNKREINEEDLLEKIAVLCEAFNQANPDVNIEPVQVQLLQRTKLQAGVAQMRFPDLEQRFETDLGVDLRAFRTLVRVGILLTLDDELSTLARWSAMVRFAVRVRVSVFNRNLSVGEVITADDFQLAWKPLEDIGFQRVATKEEAIGKSSRMAYRSGDIPRSTQLFKPILVKYGEEVEVSVGAEGMRVKARGRAVSQGSLGERVSIILVSNKKKVFGNVTGAGKVEVAQ